MEADDKEGLGHAALWHHVDTGILGGHAVLVVVHFCGNVLHRKTLVNLNSRNSN